MTATARTHHARTGWVALTDRLARVLKPLAWINLAVEILIVGTGGLVRLSGSGLGCPRWPECVSGSITPVKHQAQEWHKYVEFGNRMLTSLVSIVAVLLILAIIGHRRSSDRRALLPPALGVLGGIALQAVVGGISVLTHLNPAIVALHFLISMALVATSAWLVWQVREHRLVPVRREVRLLGAGTAFVAGLVLMLGTAVTGAGPHSGDATHPARFAFSPRSAAWLHADMVMLFCGLVVAMLVATALVEARSAFRSWRLVALVTVLQAIVGYTQYFLGVPGALVLVHMLMACLLVVAVTWGVLATRAPASTVRPTTAPRTTHVPTP
ncbi:MULTISPECIES: COX15/CtaA family protein [unclassified Allobranchiibius]|uniref:COX15/CtaA family protein n=1 Tax=unclassified Allobranchiibius TaxID=2649857 RepID=UPI001AA0CA09|nr:MULTISPECIES: COX15/CtaA family protein [unclassified Allobranchiibius]MBO1766537.1 heme A synthase [Allobranchiibius sp. GilTou38]UIJ33867.1 COX15/CtaA family protein [Allobranchiibius sp. GilTou73]